MSRAGDSSCQDSRPRADDARRNEARRAARSAGEGAGERRYQAQQGEAQHLL